MRLLSLTENKDYADAMKIFQTLPKDLKFPLEMWMAGPVRYLDEHFANDDEVAHGLIQAFEPVRERMKQRYGSTITLYRGVHYGNPISAEIEGEDDLDDEYDDYHALSSWTSSKKVAMAFAKHGNYPPRANPFPMTPDEFQQMLKDFHDGKSVMYRGFKFWHKPGDDPEAYYMRYPTRSTMLKGTGFTDYVTKNYKQHTSSYNEDEWRRWEVLEEDIPIDKIVWVLMFHNENEYIVSEEWLK